MCVCVGVGACVCGEIEDSTRSKVKNSQFYCSDNSYIPLDTAITLNHASACMACGTGNYCSLIGLMLSRCLAK